MSTNAEKYLEAYKKLEYFGKNTLFSDAKDSDNIMGRLVALPQLEKYRDDLNYCRVVRNFLTHNPKIGGHYAIEPSDEMIDFIESLTERILTPLKAIDICTPRKNMLTINTSENLFDVLTRMRTKSFTHLPVFHKNKFLGIFSEASISTFLLHNQSAEIDANTKINYFYDVIDYTMEANGSSIIFVDQEIGFEELKKIFNSHYRLGTPLSIAFITKNGKWTAPILGMLTPYDILEKGD